MGHVGISGLACSAIQDFVLVRVAASPGVAARPCMGVGEGVGVVVVDPNRPRVSVGVGVAKGVRVGPGVEGDGLGTGVGIGLGVGEENWPGVRGTSLLKHILESNVAKNSKPSTH